MVSGGLPGVVLILSVFSQLCKPSATFNIFRFSDWVGNRDALRNSIANSAKYKVKGIIVRSAPKNDIIYDCTVQDKSIWRERMIRMGIPYQNIKMIDSTEPASGRGMTLKDDIFSAVSRAIRGNDHVFLAYTGHGECGNGALRLRRDQRLTADEFLDMWVNTEEAMGKSLTMIIDACYSGHWVDTSRMYASMYPELKLEILSATDNKHGSSAYYSEGSHLSMYMDSDVKNFFREAKGYSGRNFPPQYFNSGVDRALIESKQRGEESSPSKTFAGYAKYMIRTSKADAAIHTRTLKKWLRWLKDEGFYSGALQLRKTDIVKNINAAMRTKSASRNLLEEDDATI